MPDGGERRLAVIDLGSNSFRLVVFSLGPRLLVAADGRDPRGRAHRRGAGRRRRAAAGADGARAGDDRAVRALLPRHRGRGRQAGGDVGDPRGDEPGRLPRARARALRARGARAVARGGGPLRLPGGGQLDHAGRRRRARPRRRLDAAHARGGPAGHRHALVEARRGVHDRALPPRREGEEASRSRRCGARGRGARGGAVAGARRAAGGHRRHGAQPRRRGRDRGRAALLRRPGVLDLTRRARRADRAAGRACPRPSAARSPGSSTPART